MSEIQPTPRTTLRRRPDRGSHEREQINAILDEGLVCHIGFVFEGQPFVIPTAYVRIDEELYFHGSSANRMLRTLKGETPVGATITLLDGVVLSRSAFHSSMNFRSVVLLGRATRVDDPQEKLRALNALIEHVIPGRGPDVRPPAVNEVKQTLVLKLPIQEASAKIRTGGPVEDEEDLGLGTWAGVIPLSLVPGTPQADDHVPPHIKAPAYATHYRRPQSD